MQQAPEEARKEIAAMEEEARRTMAELREVPAGKQFDFELARRIISHHNSGITEFLEVQPRADHPRLKVAATTSSVSQEAQSADFRTWLSGQAR
ncbi:DUF305 domain-containing protein [Streptomyces cellulosae]|nr:DUF305 domain-containing protein [Streptomyces cellulosae]